MIQSIPDPLKLSSNDYVMPLGVSTFVKTNSTNKIDSKEALIRGKLLPTRLQTFNSCYHLHQETTIGPSSETTPQKS